MNKIIDRIFGKKSEAIKLKSLSFEQGVTNIVAQHPAFAGFALEMANTFKELGGESAPNFISMDFSADGHAYEITMRNRGKRSQMEVLAILRKALEQLAEEGNETAIEALIEVNYLKDETRHE